MVDTYHDDLELILDSAETRTAALLLSVLLSEYGIVAAGDKISFKKIYSILKSAKSKKISNSFDISIVPAVIAAIDLLRENKPIGSVYEIARRAVDKGIEAAAEYYDDRMFDNVADRDRSARLSARWLVRDSIFTGQTEAAEKLGLTKKRWVSRHDDRVRDSHQALHGQAIPISEKFVLQNGNEISFPGDVRAPLSEVVNCRCSLEFL
ncbi:MuF-like minor capsid protein [Gordonia phage Sixama]|uniref:MuF-like minor capsid protein n=1 Tax=Gordonia phage Sixama TaxID=2653271 RepID=A0A5Q2F431_9CAUD|nr:head morphogenesis [Gordonia phage Sixama]QGF20247.1 MuF-like minor capsid protein [Gordonia phage Sixama]